MVSKCLPGKFPCDKCGSSDAVRKYADNGGTYCFACQHSTMGDGTDDTAPAPLPEKPKMSMKGKAHVMEEISRLISRPLPSRGIGVEVMKFFGVKTKRNSDGEITEHYYPYEEGRFYKIRRVADKEFYWADKSSKGLFGKECFSPGGKRIVICEGEIDALSIAQAYQDKYDKTYPVVALSSSVATKALLDNRDWLRSFDEIVLAFDNDEAGKKATVEATKYLGVDKVRICTFPENDINDVLRSRGSDAIRMLVYDAGKFIPTGILTKEALWDALANYNDIESIPYPDALEGVNGKLKGMRPGEITLFISGTGAGKSTLLRETMLHLLASTEAKLGVVSLEESPAETARKLAGMYLHKNPAKEMIPLEELKVGFDAVFSTDRVTLLDHQGSINDNSIVEQLEYMCLTGCTHLFIDHITIMVSEGVDNLHGLEAQDKVMNDLLRVVKKYPVWIGLVSHLRKSPSNSQSFEEGKLPSMDDIKGSGSIKQISFDIISFSRNSTAESEEERNTIKMRVLKSRYTGLTGNVRGAIYDYNTGRLRKSSDDPDSFEAE